VDLAAQPGWDVCRLQPRRHLPVGKPAHQHGAPVNECSDGGGDGNDHHTPVAAASATARSHAEELEMSAMNRLVEAVVERIEHMTTLDRVATPNASAVSEQFRRSRLKDVLSGSWFGHPLHPLLTDLPIGSWTSAMVLDFAGGRRAQPAADVLVAVGVATAVPTAITGLSDWSDLGDADRRIGLVHATANSAALTCYVASLVARRRGRRTAGIMLGVAGATAATAGGFLGGHLVYRRGAGVDHTVFDDGTLHVRRVPST
jgi:uncharacterized membrane protein